MLKYPFLVGTESVTESHEDKEDASYVDEQELWKAIWKFGDTMNGILVDGLSTGRIAKATPHLKLAVEVVKWIDKTRQILSPTPPSVDSIPSPLWGDTSRYNSLLPSLALFSYYRTTTFDRSLVLGLIRDCEKFLQQTLRSSENPVDNLFPILAPFSLTLETEGDDGKILAILSQFFDEGPEKIALLKDYQEEGEDDQGNLKARSVGRRTITNIKRSINNPTESELRQKKSTTIKTKLTKVDSRKRRRVDEPSEQNVNESGDIFLTGETGDGRDEGDNEDDEIGLHRNKRKNLDDYVSPSETTITNTAKSTLKQVRPTKNKNLVNSSSSFSAASAKKPRITTQAEKSISPRKSRNSSNTIEDSQIESKYSQPSQDNNGDIGDEGAEDRVDSQAYSKPSIPVGRLAVAPMTNLISAVWNEQIYGEDEQRNDDQTQVEKSFRQYLAIIVDFWQRLLKLLLIRLNEAALWDRRARQLMHTASDLANTLFIGGSATSRSDENELGHVRLTGSTMNKLLRAYVLYEDIVDCLRVGKLRNIQTSIK
jgi:hypothetical protein